MAYESVFHSLADPTRREVFERLAAKPMAVRELADVLPVSRPAVSQHLKVLSDAGLVTVQAEGTRRIYSVRPDSLEGLRRWIDQLWADALDAFARAAEEENRK